MSGSPLKAGQAPGSRAAFWGRLRDRAYAAVPLLDWGRRYNQTLLTSDLTAAVIVTIMLIPQSLAYALLAGLPPEMGLYASILPLVAYALFGTSNTLAVGPVAVVSLMTGAALGELGLTDPAEIARAAITLALLCGGIALLMATLRLGFLASFLSHPVVAGFIIASSILIATSQLKHILGVPASGATLPELLGDLLPALGAVNAVTLSLGVGVLAYLFWARARLTPILRARGWSARSSELVTKAAPVGAVIATTLIAYLFNLEDVGVALVGGIPQGLPPLAAPSFDLDLWSALLAPAALITLIGFVESVSVGQTLAAKKRERISPDQELIGLGASNLAAAFSGGYPVTGGVSRSIVNFDAGARTPAAGAFTAVGIAAATLLITPVLYCLPKATLAATIIVAVLSLVDLRTLQRTWAFSKADFAAVVATITATLFLGVEIGVSSGVALSILLFLRRTTRPHVAEVGRVPGTEHFRNVERHAVETCSSVLTIRIDECLYFANARHLEDYVYDSAHGRAELRHVVLMCSAVNDLDASAMESLEALNHRLRDAGLTLHLSEVKGPVMDRLERTQFLQDLTGEVYLSQHQASVALRRAETTS